jgi:hypothetical protein
MRTTLTLEKDVAAALERVRKLRRVSLKKAVNEALRRGLDQWAAPPPARRPVRTKAVSLGRCLVGSVDNVSEALAAGEGESFR